MNDKQNHRPIYSCDLHGMYDAVYDSMRRQRKLVAVRRIQLRARDAYEMVCDVQGLADRLQALTGFVLL